MSFERFWIVRGLHKSLNLLCELDSGAVIGGINQRKGTIVDTEIREEEFSLVCEVSLNEMFGCEFCSLLFVYER